MPELCFLFTEAGESLGLFGILREEDTPGRPRSFRIVGTTAMDIGGHYRMRRSDEAGEQVRIDSTQTLGKMSFYDVTAAGGS